MLPRRVRTAFNDLGDRFEYSAGRILALLDPRAPASRRSAHVDRALDAHSRQGALARAPIAGAETNVSIVFQSFALFHGSRCLKM